jgi:3-methylfumaryl-CoA hydratase
MFARAQYRFHRPILIGDEVRREGTILDVTAKQGRSGKLVFVKVGYVIATQSGVALEESHDIVYRDKTKAAQDAPEEHEPELPEATWRRLITPDPVLLFRYSALTFNAHRIHYDRPYAMNEEGYPGLVVHGPLIATLLLELLREHAGEKALAMFNFRAVRPLFDTEPFEVTGRLTKDGGGFWLKALDPQGQVAMAADGTFSN